MARDEGFATALAPGTDVQGYRIESILGAGGFGITYLAEHIAIGNQVALKEFLPNGIAARSLDGAAVRPVSHAQREDFEWGRTRFRDEARTLGRLKHPAIVPVLNYFEANGTAYCVMEYVGGQTLDARLGPRGTLPSAELARMLPPLLAGIETVHAAGFLHRDIKPANILLRDDGAPVLIDFGAARQALGAHSRSLTAILSEGYAPYEQYQRDGDQGPWTDIYALGGTLYRCVTGERPPEATRRVEARMKGKPDPLRPAAEAAAGRYPAALLDTIDRALGVMETERPQSIADLRALIESGAATAADDHRVPPQRRAEATLVAGGAPRGGRRRWQIAAAALALLSIGGAAAGYIVVESRRAEGRDEAARREAERVDAEMRRKADEERKRRAEEQRKAGEEARKRREAEEAEQRRLAEERRKAEEEQRRKREAEEAEQKRRAEEQRKAEEEARNRREAEEAERRRLDEERRRAEEDRRRAEEDQRRKRAEAEEAQRKRVEAARDDLAKGFAAVQGNRHDEAIELLSRAIAAGTLTDAEMAHARYTRGRAWFAKRDYDRAENDFRATLWYDPKNADVYFARGLARLQKGERLEAIGDFRTALRMSPAHSGARSALQQLGVAP